MRTVATKEEEEASVVPRTRGLLLRYIQPPTAASEELLWDAHVCPCVRVSCPHGAEMLFSSTVWWRRIHRRFPSHRHPGQLNQRAFHLHSTILPWQEKKVMQHLHTHTHTLESFFLQKLMWCLTLSSSRGGIKSSGLLEFRLSFMNYCSRHKAVKCAAKLEMKGTG